MANGQGPRPTPATRRAWGATLAWKRFLIGEDADLAVIDADDHAQAGGPVGPVAHRAVAQHHVHPPRMGRAKPPGFFVMVSMMTVADTVGWLSLYPSEYHQVELFDSYSLSHTLPLVV